MTHPAISATTPAPVDPVGLDAGFEAALDEAFARAVDATGASVVVGTVADSGADPARWSPTLQAEGVKTVGRYVTAAGNGPVAIVADGSGDAWSGFRFELGGSRAVFVMVALPTLDELESARVEAIASGLARHALEDGGRRRRGQLDRLLTTARRVAESLELETVLTSIVDDARTLLDAESGDMLLWDRERNKLRVVAVSNFPPDMLGFELDFGDGVSSRAILEQHTIEVDDYRTYPYRARALDRYDFGPVLCAPLIFRGVAIGALNLHAGGGQRGFPAGAADLLAAFAGHAAIAIDHARRYENEVRLGRVLADTNRDLSRSLTVQQRLAEQVLLDAGADGIAAVLAEHLGRSVVIQDHLHRLIAGAAPDGGDGWLHLVPDTRPTGRGTSERDPFSIAVRVGRAVVGHLLLSSDEDLGSIDRALVDVATTGVALEFAKKRAAVEVEERLRGEAIADLLTGSYPSEEAIAARAARLGHNLSEPHDILVINAAGPSGSSATLDLDPTLDHDRLRELLEQVNERLAARARQSVAIAHGGRIVVLAAAGRSAPEGGRELADGLRTTLESTVGPGRVTVALGDRCRRPDDYAPACGLAHEAVDLLLKLGREGAVISAGDLGPYGLLLRVSSRNDLATFAEQLLRPLVEHDRSHGGDLISTLRAYLEEDRVQRRVAARCFIHVNTVVYRVRRIEELLGVDLGDPKVVFDVTLALRILDVLAPSTEIASPASPAARSR
ncbi:MAG: helix-turn-helix domain-containing protein [Chloroflexi bacterium]|nr:helix-turn-helix domain-containing protein [Chloroflexota bacterium]